LLLNFEAWRSALIGSRVEEENGYRLSEETAATLDRLQNEADHIYQTISILAPDSIVNLAAGYFMILAAWSHSLTSGRRGDEVNPFSGEKDNYLSDAWKEHELLREAIRRDLGIDAGDTNRRN
jgi:hypothetical protein